MKIALFCTAVALLHLEANSIIASGSPPATCACSKLIADEIKQLRISLSEDLEKLRKEGVPSITEEPTCPRSLGMSSYKPAQSCREIFQCNPSAPSGNYWLNSAESGSREVYCAMDTYCDITGGWTRLAYINMNESTARCPTSLRKIDAPINLCGRKAGGCSGVTFPTEGVRYSKVCGQARGYQYYSPDAFGHGYTDINSYYVDGIAITYGTAPRNHIWTYAAGLSDDGNYAGGVLNCPCAKIPGKDPPTFVGQDYYCESGITGRWEDNNRIALDDPLWDGDGCGEGNSCCDQTGLPWFYRVLPQEVGDDIEVRVCCNEGQGNEDVYVDLLEIYVQ